MQNRATRAALLAIVVILGLIAARPYVEYRLYAATTPRQVEPRGDLAEFEKTTIAIFDRVSPSVVQVVGRSANANNQEGQEGVQSGTGFMWDAAGHVVTNNHVVENTNALAVRLASGEAV